VPPGVTGRFVWGFLSPTTCKGELVLAGHVTYTMLMYNVMGSTNRCLIIEPKI